MSKILHGTVSSSFDFLGKYKLARYKKITYPTVFFGAYIHRYSKTNFNRLLEHKALGVIVWRGSDIMLLRQKDDEVKKVMLEKLKKKENLRHVAIGRFIERDLEHFGIDYVRLPITAVKPITNPQPLGDSIYCYLPNTTTEQRDFYGGSIVDELKKLLPDEKFIITTGNHPDVKELYKQCYLGLRLTRHDGLPNTVLEMGLMGRRCIYNDVRVPNAIPWKGIEDLVSIIKRERKRLPQIDMVAESVRNYIDIPNNWLDTNFWK